MLKIRRNVSAALLVAAILTTTGMTVFAGDNDGWTQVNQTQAAKDGIWSKWCSNWETIKNNPTQMSLTTGKNATELNFTWYSKDKETAPKLKIGKNKQMTDSKQLVVATTPATTGYKSNKATVTNLAENTTYYYSYQVDGKWTNATIYKTQSTKSFSFLYVGDPQIGSSSSNTAKGASAEQGQDVAVRNDSFNWNNTINTALKSHPNVSFMLSAGDQIQSSDKKNPVYTGNEIEYAGYLSPSALKSLPVATSIGNHDSPNTNYSNHFNNPNATKLGITPAGGDYYYSYGNALFIMLNTNNTNIAEHQKVIEQAVKSNPNAKWRITTIHQDIYGSGEHSNEPDIVNLRYQLIPILEKNNIDVVLTGHDHTYSRSLILNGGVQDKSKSITADEFDNYTDGKTATDSKYNDYLSSIEDTNAVQNVTLKSGSVVNPKGILYMTANSGSGSKYYDLVPHKQSYIAARWQEDVPTYSDIDINDTKFTINTYRTDTGAKIDNTYSIIKTSNGAKTTKPSKSTKVTSTSNSSISIGSVKAGDDFSVGTIAILTLSLVGLAYLYKHEIC
ncbi:metallophosphoesterase family protein [Clostridium algoriphilum]|uniref:purple acid phosphatase family protein n=1 Tax=Clostridium algoriphilum TaxID=198347 RepID=UPI001CF4AD69|nr:metallophosphoesterase family protein [Clostridium algoriphilum]MCB2294961.1 metallophosphoesterase family protein [Clostridium algoriphilum]